MHYYKGKSSKLPYIWNVCFPQRWVPFNDPWYLYVWKIHLVRKYGTFDGCEKKELATPKPVTCSCLSIPSNGILVYSKGLHSLKRIRQRVKHLKMDGWNMLERSFPFGISPYFQGLLLLVSGRVPYSVLWIQTLKGKRCFPKHPLTSASVWSSGKY